MLNCIVTKIKNGLTLGDQEKQWISYKILNNPKDYVKILFFLEICPHYIWNKFCKEYFPVPEPLIQGYKLVAIKNAIKFYEQLQVCIPQYLHQMLVYSEQMTNTSNN